MNQDSTTATVRADERILGTTNELFTHTNKKKHEHTHTEYIQQEPHVAVARVVRRMERSGIKVSVWRERIRSGKLYLNLVCSVDECVRRAKNT